MPAEVAGGVGHRRALDDDREQVAAIRRSEDAELDALGRRRRARRSSTSAAPARRGLRALEREADSVRDRIPQAARDDRGCSVRAAAAGRSGRSAGSVRPSSVDRLPDQRAADADRLAHPVVLVGDGDDPLEHAARVRAHARRNPRRSGRSRGSTWRPGAGSGSRAGRRSPPHRAARDVCVSIRTPARSRISETARGQQDAGPLVLGDDRMLRAQVHVRLDERRGHQLRRVGADDDRPLALTDLGEADRLSRESGRRQRGSRGGTPGCPWPRRATRAARAARSCRPSRWPAGTWGIPLPSAPLWWPRLLGGACDFTVPRRPRRTDLLHVCPPQGAANCWNSYLLQTEGKPLG